VLPSLQLLHPDLFTKNLSIAALKEHVKRVCVKRSENRQTLSELLCGFFEHFAFNFQFDKEIMSVRAASVSCILFILFSSFSSGFLVSSADPVCFCSMLANVAEVDFQVFADDYFQNLGSAKPVV